MRIKYLVLAVLVLSVGLCSSISMADIISHPGLTVLSTAPSTVQMNFLWSPVDTGNTAVIFNEQQNVILLNDLVTDTGTIASGTLVSSYFIALNAKPATPPSDGLTLDSTITFSGQVLGVVYLDPSSNPALNLFLQSNFLGTSGTSYDICPFCGYESGDSAIPSGKTVHINATFDAPGDFARVITAGSSPVPEPSAILLLGTGLIGGVAATRRKFIR